MVTLASIVAYLGLIGSVVAEDSVGAAYAHSGPIPVGLTAALAAGALLTVSLATACAWCFVQAARDAEHSNKDQA